MTYCERVSFLCQQHFDQFYNINSRVGTHLVQRLGCTALRTATRSPEHNSRPTVILHVLATAGVSISKRRVQKSKNRSCVEAAQVTRTLPVKINGLLNFQRKTCLA